MSHADFARFAFTDELRRLTPTTWVGSDSTSPDVHSGAPSSLYSNSAQMQI